MLLRPFAEAWGMLSVFVSSPGVGLVSVRAGEKGKMEEARADIFYAWRAKRGALVSCVSLCGYR